jgi:hypothetical protein
LCQPGRQNRASPPKGVSRDFQVARQNHLSNCESRSTSRLSLSNARFRETGAR